MTSITYAKGCIRLCIVAVACVSTACGSGRPTYNALNVPQRVSAQNTAYEIGPGDSLQIFVWEHDNLSTAVQVRPDGKISTPLVEDMQAAGKTPTELARNIEDVLREFVRTPVVTVIMQGFVGEGQQQIRVVGQAAEPSVLQYRQGMRVLDVIIEVGGLDEFAAGNKARIVRRTPEGEVEIRIRLSDLLNEGRTEENIEMMPGDVLVIPQSFF